MAQTGIPAQSGEVDARYHAAACARFVAHAETARRVNRQRHSVGGVGPVPVLYSDLRPLDRTFGVGDRRRARHLRARDIHCAYRAAEPVTITQYGRPTLLLMRHQDGIELLRDIAGKQAIAVLNERQKNMPQAAKDATLEEINALVDEARS